MVAVHLQMVESTSTASGPSPGPAPAAQARQGSPSDPVELADVTKGSYAARSHGGGSHHPGGAEARSRRPERSSSTSSMQSPPATKACTNVSSLRPGRGCGPAGPRSTSWSAACSIPSRSGQGGGQQQPGRGDRMLVVKDDIDLVQHHMRGSIERCRPTRGSYCLAAVILPRSRDPFHTSDTTSPRARSVDPGSAHAPAYQPRSRRTLPSHSRVRASPGSSPTSRRIDRASSRRCSASGVGPAPPARRRPGWSARPGDGGRPRTADRRACS